MGGFLTNTVWFAYGCRAFTRAAAERAAARFAPLPRAAGRTVIVTGANSGLGLATARALAAAGATVVMACRSIERGEAAAAAIRRDIGATTSGGKAGSSNTGGNSAGSGGSGGIGSVEVAELDVASLDSVRAFADAYVASGRPLHALVNNAGALLAERGASADGFDLSFATNTLGGVALAARLLPALRATAEAEAAKAAARGGDGGGGAAPFTPRVVFVSSGGAYTERLEMDGWRAPAAAAAGPPPQWDGVRAYAQDKRRQIAAAAALARRWAPLGALVCSCHPGWADTEGVRSALPGFAKMMGAALRTPEQGADTPVWLALEDAAKIEPGGFYLDRALQAQHLSLSGTRHTDAAADELVDRLLALAGAAS